MGRLSRLQVRTAGIGYRLARSGLKPRSFVLLFTAFHSTHVFTSIEPVIKASTVRYRSWTGLIVTSSRAWALAVMHRAGRRHPCHLIRHSKDPLQRPNRCGLYAMPLLYGSA